MKKVLLFLFALLTTVTVWAQTFTPLQMGENNGIELGSESGYLSFSPEETGYYVFSTNSDVSHSICINLWSDSIYYAYSPWNGNGYVPGEYTCDLGYQNKLYAGKTYKFRIVPRDNSLTGQAQVTVRKGYIVSPDAESAELTNFLSSLPVVAYEGQEVKLTVVSGAIIHSLTATTANGEPIELTADGSGQVYSFTMPAADVIISGSGEMATLQLGDNEVDLTGEGTQFLFTPAESGAYVFSMNCGAPAMVIVAQNNDRLNYAYTEAGQNLTFGVMLEAGVTYTVFASISAESLEGAVLNITKRELDPIVVGENVIDVPYGTYFDYPFTPPVSGDYTFYTTGDAALYPDATLLLGQQQLAMYYSGAMDLNFTATLEAGVTYTLKLGIHNGFGFAPMHLTVSTSGGPSGGDDPVVLQMGDTGPIVFSNTGPYMSFTPEETGYYVFTTISNGAPFGLVFNDDVQVVSESAPFPGLYGCEISYPQQLIGGQTYNLYIFSFDNASGQAWVTIRKGYLVSPDAESADLANVLSPLPTVAYEGQEVKLTTTAGATISNLTATANGESIEINSYINGSSTVYTFIMPAADVTISGSSDMVTLTLGDNEVDLNSEGSPMVFKPAESGAYVFSMNCGVEAAANLISSNSQITYGYAEAGQTLVMGAMLEANETYLVYPMIREGSLEGSILNIAKHELAPITVGENEIDAPYGTYFDYPFTPAVSGEYTFYTTGDAEINFQAWLLLGGNEIASDSDGGELNFTATLEAGVTYIFRAECWEYGINPLHLTVTNSGGSSGGNEFITLHLGENGPIGINGSEGQYMKFTPEETGYYVFVGNSDVANEMYINLWSDNLYKVDSEPEVISGVSRHVSYLGYPQLLYAGQTYNMSMYAKGGDDVTGVATINVVKGYLVSPDAESADLASMLDRLPVAAYEGQEVKLKVVNGVTIHSLTAETANGDPIELTLDDSGTVYSFTMPAVDVTISGSGEMASLQLGDNEVNLTDQGSQFTFTPAESGAYVFSMDCGAMAAIYVALGNDLVAYDEAEAGQTLEMGAMLEAGVTYLVYPMIREGYIEGAILNIAKRELAPITIGENEVDTPNNGFCFDYPFTPPVSGDYTFYTTDDEALYPTATLMLGEQEIAMCNNGAMDLNFTATLEAGVTYTLKLSHSVSGSGLLPLHLTVVSPPLPSFAINLPSEFEHGTVECDKETADYGETVTLTVKPDDGYELRSLTVTTIDIEPSGAPLQRLRGTNVELTPGDNGTYTFEMPAAPVAVNAVFKKSYPTAIEGIDADKPKSGQRYDLLGRPVGPDYKGIVIENGKKLIVR